MTSSGQNQWSFDPGWPASVFDWMSRADRQPIFAVDSHTAGTPTRIILSGVNLPADVTTVRDARAWLRAEADWIRRRIVHEPRGGGLTCAVLPVATSRDDPQDGWDIGAVILEPGAYPPMCGHCMIGFAAVIAELDLLPHLWNDDRSTMTVRILAPAGVVTATVQSDEDAGFRVELANVPSYPVRRDTYTLADGTPVTVDLLWGGDYYLTIDATTIPLDLSRRNSTQITMLGRQVREAAQKRELIDPATGEVLDVYQVMFFERLGSHASVVRSVVVAPPAQIDRSPCGTGTSALLSYLTSTGELPAESIMRSRSIIDAEFTARATDLEIVNGRTQVVPHIGGTAHINGFLTIVADKNDRLADGFDPI